MSLIITNTASRCGLKKPQDADCASPDDQVARLQHTSRRHIVHWSCAVVRNVFTWRVILSPTVDAVATDVSRTHCIHQKHLQKHGHPCHSLRRHQQVMHSTTSHPMTILCAVLATLRSPLSHTQIAAKASSPFTAPFQMASWHPPSSHTILSLGHVGPFVRFPARHVSRCLYAGTEWFSRYRAKHDVIMQRLALSS